LITIYGASDDLVEVAGCEGADEFCTDRWQGDLAPPGEVEQMRVHCWYDNDGCWQVGVGMVDEDVPFPAWPLSFAQGGVTADALAGKAPATPRYSVVLTIDAPEGTRLVNVKPEPEQ
jgi:hypothetical protein